MYLIPSTDERSKALLPLHVLTIGTDFDQPPSHRPNGNSFHHIFFVEKGEGIFETATGRHIFGEGSVMFMRKGVPIHYYSCGDRFKTGWVTFDGPGVDDLLSYFHAEDFMSLTDHQMRQLLRSCVKATERGAPAAILSKLAFDLIVTFFEHSEKGQKHAALTQARDFMREHCARDLSVAEIAATVKVSESLLYRLFRAEGTTPVEYLRRCRLERAKRYLLEEPTLRVAEIATLCGFSDSAYFCKVFRDVELVTPRTYRSLYL